MIPTQGVAASCQSISSVPDLVASSEAAFLGDRATTPQDLRTVETQLNGIDQDEVQVLLQEMDAVQNGPSVDLFIQNQRRAVDIYKSHGLRAMRNYVRQPAFQAQLGALVQIINDICNENNPLTNTTNAIETAISRLAATLSGVTDGAEPINHRPGTGSKSNLAIVFLLFLLLILFVKIGVYIYSWCAALLLKRHDCLIPVRITSGGKKFDAHIYVIGRVGCAIRVEKLFGPYKSGPFEQDRVIRIRSGQTTLLARQTRETDEDGLSAGFVFQTQLNPHLLAEMLSRSKIKPRRKRQRRATVVGSLGST